MRVFLDLWGVLLDSDTMQREYGRRLVRHLMERFGGDEARWLVAHNAAWTDYVQAVESTDWNRASWAATVDRLDGRFAVGLLERAGIAWRPPDAAAFARTLERDLMSTVNARFPDARAAVERLRAGGHTVYVATQATDSNARGALGGAGLLESLDGIFTGTSQDAPKTQRGYWDKVLAQVGGDPQSCVLVDDRVDYLAAAHALGVVGLLLDREEVYDPPRVPSYVKATLRNLAGLPHFVDVLASDAGHTSA